MSKHKPHKKPSEKNDDNKKKRKRSPRKKTIWDPNKITILPKPLISNDPVHHVKTVLNCKNMTNKDLKRYRVNDEFENKLQIRLAEHIRDFKSIEVARILTKLGNKFRKKSECADNIKKGE